MGNEGEFIFKLIFFISKQRNICSRDGSRCPSGITCPILIGCAVKQPSACAMWACVLSPVWLFATLWTGTCQAPLFMELSRHEYWSGLPFPTPGDLPDPRIKSMSLASHALAGGFFTNCTTWEAHIHHIHTNMFMFIKDYKHTIIKELKYETINYLIVTWPLRNKRNLIKSQNLKEYLILSWWVKLTVSPYWLENKQVWVGNGPMAYTMP